MNSEKRKIAARLNGARSKGPKTVEGKARSALNATRHGMLAQTVLLPNECPATFRALHDAFIEEFQPVGEVEHGFVEEMAVCHWRIRRGWAIETELFKQGLESTPPGTPAQAEIARLAVSFTELSVTPQLGLLNRYESRLHRMFQRALKNLQLLRESRAKAVQRAAEVDKAAQVAPTPPVETKPDTSAAQPKLQICQTNPSPTPETRPAAPVSAASDPPDPRRPGEKVA